MSEQSRVTVLAQTTSAMLLLTMAISSAMAAEYLQMKPGMWESETTMTSNMFGTRTSTDRECVTADSFDPKKMMQGMPADQCQIDTSVSGSVMDYTINCNMGDGGTISGTGRVETEGDTSKGEMSMTGSMQGMSMEMKVVSTGKRVGDC